MKKNQNKYSKLEAFLLLITVYASLIMDIDIKTLEAGKKMNYDSSLFIYAFIQFLVISIVMMFIPFLFKMIYHFDLENKKGKKICKMNSIVLFIISIFLTSLNLQFVGGLGAIIYYFINVRLFVSPEKTYHDSAMDELDALLDRYKMINCQVCNKEIPYNENGTCQECHEEIMRRLAAKSK